ncbi:MAG: MoxR family ATPase [Planctomycetes bacterium]|nr:MoxR family ATPase [Planctomycetota bacterium]
MPALAAAAPAAVGDKELVAQAQEAFERIRGELAKVIVGQDTVIEELIIAIFARGHCMLEGVPGLAKTLLISTLARTLHLSFKRIQFTPDLMPSDIVGTEVLQEDPATKARVFKFLRGPIFANIVLADEINRTPPKTQAALLEAMQEKKVSVGNDEFKLDAPFFVLATQNPIDQEGTYPLPEAQLDRFLFKVFVGYPSDEEELEVMRRVASPQMASNEKAVRQVLDGAQIVAFQQLVLRVPVADHVLQYAKALVRATRPGTEEAPDFIKEWISWGAGPRASINLILAAKARAVIHGNFHATIEDIDAVAKPVLRHRIACSYTATAEDVTTDHVVERLIASIPKHEKAPAAKAAAKR